MTTLLALIALALTTQGSATVQPCRVIEPTAAQRNADYVNAIAHGPFAMLTVAGGRSCEFRAPGEGVCRLTDPRLIHITIDGIHTWYQVDAGRRVRVEVSNRVATCQVVG